MQKIYLGASPGDKTGTPARQAGVIINDNFELLGNEVFKDTVLKTGVITLAGLNVSIAANAFAWRINQINFTVPIAFSGALVAAAAGNFRFDLLLGNLSGTYEILQGAESNTAAVIPLKPINKIVLAVFSINENSTEIDYLKANVPLRSKFTLVQKSTENANNTIEINDYARGFGPGVGVDQEYYNFAQYLNLTGDNNVNNHLNYKPVTVSLPNS